MIHILRLVGLLVLLFPAVQFGYTQTYYWIGFTDKNNTGYSIDNPEAFLSERAILRRLKQNIAIDEKDLPVNKEYIFQVLNFGAEYQHHSKWLNGVTVKSNLPDFDEKVFSLDFVREVQATKTVTNKSAKLNKFEIENVKIDSALYGQSVSQISQINGHFLHERGYLGNSILIAVLDAGFYNVNEFPAFDSLWAKKHILGTIDFVNNNSDIFAQNNHGMKVLSIMGGNIPGQLIGTAPEAFYWLIRTEDVATEFLLEEDNWVVGAEFADSVGADIINSSLGYSVFDDPAMNHTYGDMDGNTTRVTQAANIAASRGMIVFNSAGNSGNSSWKYLIAPSDGDDVIGVGAVDANGTKAGFSSFGPSSDGDIKPNLAAMGYKTVLQNTTGTVSTGSGTSFSSPVLAGMTACLWQAFPEFTAIQIKQILEESASQYESPDSLIGYGIPDYELAMQIAESRRIKIPPPMGDWYYYPNPFKDYVVFKNDDSTFDENVTIEIYGTNGIRYYHRDFSNRYFLCLNDLESVPPGVIFVKLITLNEINTYKFIKVR